jgi:hypothetical protein
MVAVGAPGLSWVARSFHSVGTEGSLDGLQPCLLNGPCLALCSLDQAVEVLPRGSRASAKAQPERAFARDAHEESLEFQHIAQWRALSESSIWREATKSFADARKRVLHPVALDSEAPHDGLQRDEVLVNLGRDLREVACRGTGVCDASRQARPSHTRGVVVPEVDGEERSLHALARRPPLTQRMLCGFRLPKATRSSERRTAGSSVAAR